MRLAFLYWALAFAVLAVGGAWVCPGGLCEPTGLDRAGLALANAWRGAPADRFFAAVTWLGSLWVLAPLFGFAGAAAPLRNGVTSGLPPSRSRSMRVSRHCSHCSR